MTRSQPTLERWLTQLTALDDVHGSLVVGCSGGADSLALLALVRAAGFAATAVYVDHGLRIGTEHEAEVVAAAAARVGAAALVRRVEVAPGSNLEARAREARYEALASVAQESTAAAIVVGHTRDDQAETVLLNLLRGSATTGMAGIPERRGRLRRPLLALRRADTREICALCSFAPVHDAMNDDEHYRRVWLRREVMPRLVQGARRDLVEVLARQAALVRDDDVLLDALALDAIPIGETLDAHAVAAAPPALARRAVRRWLGGVPPPADLVELVLAVARGERRAAQVAGAQRIERVHGRLHRIVAPEVAPDDTLWDLPGRVRFGRWDLDARIEHGPPISWPDGRTIAVLDADRLDDRIVVRGPRAGDRFRPMGAGGTKAVHDALAEAGVPASRRTSRPVVTTANGEICWVVGYRIDERVKVTSRTRRYLWISSEAQPQVSRDR